MSKRLFLQVKWQETKEKNNQKAGGDGCYQEVVEQGGKIALLGLGQDALVKQVNQDGVLLQIPHKGECLLKFDQPTTFSYGDGYQVAGDWVDVRQTFELTLLAPQQQEGVQLEIRGDVLLKVSTTDAKVVVPEGITRIAQSAFAKLLVEEVVLPESVREIGNYAFEYCKFLKKINLPKSLESIGYGAFSHTAVEHFDIPHSLEDLQPYAFCRTPFLKKFQGQDFVVLGNGLLYLYSGLGGEVVVPDGVRVICPRALSSLNDSNGRRGLSQYITKVVLPNSVQKICSGAFFQQRELAEINVGKHMEIALDAFKQTAFEQEFERLVQNN